MCYKKSYISRKDAKEAARLLRKINQVGIYKRGRLIKRDRLRPYQCDRCGDWHLTSQK